jgi:hypothetical protein
MLIKIVTERGYIRRYEKNHDKKGVNNWNYKNGISQHGEYVLIYKPNHPNAQRGGYILEHRYIMSEYIGRPLRDNEEVHHINGNEKDNRIENLQLVTSSEHTTIHNIVDMSDRVCLLCKSKVTYLKPNNNSPKWHRYEDGHICSNCYLRNYHMFRKYAEY